MGLRALLKGPTAVQILSWPHLGSNHRPCGSKSSSLTTMLQAELCTLNEHARFIQPAYRRASPDSDFLLESGWRPALWPEVLGLHSKCKRRDYFRNAVTPKRADIPKCTALLLQRLPALTRESNSCERQSLKKCKHYKASFFRVGFD